MNFTLALTNSGQVKKWTTDARLAGSDLWDWRMDDTWDPSMMIDFELDPEIVVYDLTAGKYHAAMLVIGDVYTGYRHRTQPAEDV